MRNRVHLPAASVLALCLAAGTASAAPILRVQVDQKGDFLLIGNTIGYDCAGGTPAPVVGTIGACGANTADSAPDIFWRSESPAAGQAQANNTIALGQARSTAKLNIPVGATVTHAFLYWGATLPAAGVDTTVTLDRPGGFTQTITALTSYQSANNSYQSVADVTALVQANGTGTYRVSGIDSDNWIDLNTSNNFGGWWMAVFYSDGTTALRNLALYEGLDTVSNGNNQNVALSGFLVPAFGFTGKLGVITYEGDATITGDQMFFNGGPALFDAQNPVNNFFNGTRSNQGLPVSVVGDLPQLTGTQGSMSGMDLDVIDVTAKLTAGQTSAPIQATSTGDVYYLAGFITSISTFKPDFSTSVKTAVDVNGGSLLVGDVLQYTIVVNNTGNDASINTVLTDAIPAGVTYVPGSLQITVGANAGNKTDALADDQGEFNAGTVKFRLGVGANGATGGTIPINGSTTVSFKVTVNAGAMGTIANQATINAGGSLGAPASDTPTDGNGPTAGAPPTTVVIDQCATDAECSAPTPHCNTAVSPKVCVQCLTDAQCPPVTPTCAPATNTCVCVPSGAEVCDGKDNDCNGTVDDGFSVGTPCSAGVGACFASGAIACNVMGTSSCSAVAGSPTPESCLDLLDNDCDGTVNNGCLDTDGDGLPDLYENAIGTNPNDADSDDDGVPDGQEINPAADSDGDGLINALDPDSDNDGLYDGTEMGKDCNGPGTDKSKNHCIADADPATTTDPLDPDTDNGGVKDGSEDANRNGKVDAGEGDPTAGHGADDATIVDTDKDGLSDIFEIAIGSNPNDADTDDDGVIDGLEPNPADDSDGDGIINVLDVDSDNDGLYDGTEMGKDCSNPATDASKQHCIADADPATKTSPLDPDTDHGGVKDASEDANRNGKIDAGETDPTAGHPEDDSTVVDTDKDGLSDIFEIAIGSDPNDADTDDDGVIDGQEANPADDTDGDGLINVLDVDSDNDGLYDGTEQGKDCSNPATDTTKHHCIADADPATKTSPLDPDTDHGGVKDGSEDANRNGKLDAGEGDPTAGHGADDSTLVDSDGDGLTDIFEIAIGSNPMDADSDDDGVIDGLEPNPADDTDGDGTINVLDVDSDNDGLYDGTEMGKDCGNPATDNTKHHCIADGDLGATKTSPLDPDTDHGGVKDGSEDINRNGVVDGTETNPTAGHGSDDSVNKDTDGDGLSDVFEVSIGTDPNDADSDDDGVIDGQEPNPADDTDGDGKINALDPDSDEDGLFDGTELGKDCGNPATDPAKKQCIPDADKGATTTNPLDPDTDKGSVKDGTEDANHNGQVDPGETDPNLKSDDVPTTGCKTDVDCGTATSGRVCDDTSKTCVDGCRGTGGNTCPDGKVCSSMSATVGMCVDSTTSTGTGTSTSTGTGSGGAGGADGIVASGNGLLCSATPGNNDDDGASWLLGGALVALVGARRRRRAA
jgi:uncharacterized repeat protein (TIGR01451 family)/MYXO-CTERM domain-containing protein